MSDPSRPSFLLSAFNASAHGQVLDDEELFDMDMGWKSITQGLENTFHVLSEPEIPLNEIVNIQSRFSNLTLEISTLSTLYVRNLHRYHEHESKTQKLLQTSHLTESQWTDLIGRYEALSFLSANLTPEKAAWTKWVDASKTDDYARRGLKVFEAELSRLDIMRAKVKEINSYLDCLALKATS